MPSRDTFSADFQDFGIPDALRGAGTVQRKTRIDYLGDTHGNHEGFVFNMRKLGLVNDTGDWIGRKRNLMLLGDIYADRHLGSFQTAYHIEKLIGQGAQIEQLAGNHEDIMLSYLDDIHHPRQSVLRKFSDIYFFGDTRDIDEYCGLQEFATFEEHHPDSLNWQNLLVGSHPATILENMRKSSRGYEILTNICRLKIGKVIDDTLCLHTDPTDAIMDMLERYGCDIEKINDVFQLYLLQTLLQGKSPDRDLWEEVIKIRDCFLNVNNRRTDDEGRQLLSPGSAARLKKKIEIRRIIHGHSKYKHEPTIFRGGLEITSADHSSFKGGNTPPWNSRTSAGSILTNGHRIGPKN